jgi:hypothetical protein
MIGEALPLLARQLIPYLALGHGLFNLLVFGLFVRQGWLGLAIRRARQNGTPPPLTAIRNHRRTGPLAALLGGAGFLAGIVLVIFDKGKLVAYPLHLSVGSVIVLTLGGLYALSRRIKGADSPYRTSHARLGLLLLCLYLVQGFLGLGILL